MYIILDCILNRLENTKLKLNNKTGLLIRFVARMYNNYLYQPMDWELITNDNQNSGYFNQLLLQQQVAILGQNLAMQPQNEQIKEQDSCQLSGNIEKYKYAMKKLQQIYRTHDYDDHQIEEKVRIIQIYADKIQSYQSIQVKLDSIFLRKNRDTFKYVTFQELLEAKYVKLRHKRTNKNNKGCIAYTKILSDRTILPECLKKCINKDEQLTKRILLMIDPPNQFKPIFEQAEQLIRQILNNSQNKVLDCMYKIYSQYIKFYNKCTQQKAEKLKQLIFKDYMLEALKRISYKIVPSRNFYGMNLNKKIMVNVFKVARNYYWLISQTFGQNKQQIDQNVLSIKKCSVVFISIIILHQMMHFIVRYQGNLNFKNDSQFQFQFRFSRKEGNQKQFFRSFFMNNLWNAENYKQFQKLSQKYKMISVLALEKQQLFSSIILKYQ